MTPSSFHPPGASTKSYNDPISDISASSWRSCKRGIKANDSSAQKLPPASLEEAELLASVAELAQHEVQTKANARKRDDVDDILVCHEELDHESPKRPCVMTFRPSERSPFKPYRHCKANTPPKPVPQEPQRRDFERKTGYWDHYVDDRDPRFVIYPAPYSQIFSIHGPFPVPRYRQRMEFVPYKRHPSFHPSTPVLTSSPPPEYSSPGCYVRDSYTPDMLCPSKNPRSTRPVTILHQRFSWKNCPEVRAEKDSSFVRAFTDLPKERC